MLRKLGPCGIVFVLFLCFHFWNFFLTCFFGTKIKKECLICILRNSFCPLDSIYFFLVPQILFFVLEYVSQKEFFGIAPITWTKRVPAGPRSKETLNCSKRTLPNGRFNETWSYSLHGRAASTLFWGVSIWPLHFHVLNFENCTHNYLHSPINNHICVIITDQRLSEQPLHVFQV